MTATSHPAILQGHAVDVLAAMPDRHVDMVYVDPPYFTQQVWSGRAGAFSDRWRWGEPAYRDRVALGFTRADVAELITTLFGENPQGAYYLAMARLLVALRRVMAPAATLWLQADDKAIAGLRVIGDAVFGPPLALGTLVWVRTQGAHSQTGRRMGRVHDTIAVWARSRVARWRLSRIRGEFTFGDPCQRLRVDGFIDRCWVGARERVGYPTQKPVALLDRIIRSATLPGAMVLDPVMGSGTTLVAAHAAGRRAIGIDASADAIAIAHTRVRRRHEAAVLSGEAAA